MVAGAGSKESICGCVAVMVKEYGFGFGSFFGALVVGCCLALQVGNSAGAWEMASTIQLTMKVTWLTVHVWACTRMHTRPSFFFACK